jgi:hypothetical protein
MACPLCEATSFFASTDQPASDEIVCCEGCGGRYTYGFLLRRTPTRSAEKQPTEKAATAEPPRKEAAVLTAYLVQEVAKAAYFRAQNRGLAPGYEQQDWYEAESIVLQKALSRQIDR